MTGTRASLLISAVVLAPALAACGISVDKDDGGRNKKVSITSPMGNLSVDANSETPPDTGLAVHAGARAVHEKRHDNANVDIDSAFFGVKVAVARYEDDMAPGALLDYYRKELAKYGSVTECRGNLDFKQSGPRCRERDRDETQLGAGSEDESHVVSVRPRGRGSEFTLIHVQMKG